MYCLKTLFERLDLWLSVSARNSDVNLCVISILMMTDTKNDEKLRKVVDSEEEWSE